MTVKKKLMWWTMSGRRTRGMVAWIARTWLWVCVSMFSVRVATTAEPIPETIQFNRDVRPILADHCFACHGPDKNQRKAELRLDQEQGLLGTSDAPGPVVRQER